MSAPSDSILARYLSGELSPGEADRVRQWLAEHPGADAALRRLDEATRRVAPSRPVDVEAALRAVKTRRAAPRRASRVSVRMIAAASVLFLAGVYASWSHRSGQAVAEYATGIGQVDTIALEGASVAVLAPASRLTVRGRELALVGDGFFAIRENPGGYRVRVGDVTVRDIGTEFGIASAGGAVRVVVASGIVEIARGATRLTVDSGDVAEVGGDITVRRDALTRDELAWTDGRIVLRDASLREVAAQLRRWRGVDLRVDSTLAGRRFTGQFAAQEPARRIVEVVALAVGARMAGAGDTLRLVPAAR